MELTTSSQEVLLCETCGDEGYTNAFVYCVKCLGVCIHRYCLDVLPRTLDEVVPWLCEACKSTVPSDFTLPKKLNASLSQKKNTTSSSSALVKTSRRKKKPKKKQKKKRKTSPLEAGKDICVSPTNSLLKEASVSSSECNKITPCVVSSLQKGIIEKQASDSSQLINKCSPLKGNAKRKRNAIPLVEKTKEHRTRETEDSIDHSCCGSSCTDVTLKNKVGVTLSTEDPKCEIQQSETSHDKLESDSSSMEKKIYKENEDYDGQAETANQMLNDQDMRARKAGADDFHSSEFKNNVQYINYQPARPVLDPVWRGSFNITQTDYDLFEGFVGHLSSKACSKVCEEATMLPSLLSLEMHSKTALWPKSFLQSQPSDENIALYFFPGDAKVEREFEHLVMDMVDEGLAMRAVAKNAELLIFTSTVLPLSYWRFQGKYYLWGVFRGKRVDSLPPLNHRRAVSTNVDDHGMPKDSSNEVTSGRGILTRVKTFGSQSPQSPLCDHSDHSLDMDLESDD